MAESSTNGSEWKPTWDKRLPRSQEVFEKAIQALRIQNLSEAFKLNSANARRMLKEHGASVAEDGGDEMRIDSDDVHYHYHQPKPDTLTPLLKLAGAALIASGVGAPLGIAAWKLPDILQALRPVEQQGGDIWSQYDLVVGRPQHAEK